MPKGKGGDAGKYAVECLERLEKTKFPASKKRKGRIRGKPTRPELK